MYKGKYREGRDKADPTMWKTRLRCALNKSTDFEEVPERNQLDITEPYKVYRINSSGEPPRPAGVTQEKGFKCFWFWEGDVSFVLFLRPPPEPEEQSRARKSPENTVAPDKQVKPKPDLIGWK